MATASSSHLPPELRAHANLVLVVGSPQVRLRALRQCLMEMSTVFNKMLVSDHQAKLHLPDDDPAVITLILSILHDQMQDLEIRIDDLSVNDLFNLAKTAQKYAVLHHIAHLPIDTNGLAECMAASKVRALFVACAFGPPIMVHYLLAQLVTHLVVDEEGWWWVGSRFPGSAEPDLLTFEWSSGYGFIKTRLLDADSCCPEMSDFILRQQESSLAATLCFIKCIYASIASSGTPQFEDTAPIARDLELRYIKEAEQNLLREAVEDLTVRLPDQARSLSRYCLWVSVLHVRGSSWPEATKSLVEDRENFDKRMWWGWVDLLSRIEQQIGIIERNKWEGRCEDGLLGWYLSEVGE